MSQKIEDSTREQVAIFLPLAISKAANSYRDFMEVEKDKNASQKFAEHHKAGKVAIAHLELLLRLARWADLPGDQAAEQLEELEAMISASSSNNEAAAEEAEDEDLA
jgi:hypothetical protein